MVQSGYAEVTDAPTHGGKFLLFFKKKTYQLVDQMSVNGKIHAVRPVQRFLLEYRLLLVFDKQPV